eukprot:15304276-Heterocapsa_arctica.AAC.1
MDTTGPASSRLDEVLRHTGMQQPGPVGKTDDAASRLDPSLQDIDAQSSLPEGETDPAPTRPDNLKAAEAYLAATMHQTFSKEAVIKAAQLGTQL